MTSEEIMRVIKMPLGQIKPNPNQPRKIFEEEALGRLASSLKVEGQIEPIKVSANGSDYVIIDGERRYRAAQLAGWDEIDAIVQEVDGEIYIRSVVANMQREDLLPKEEFEVYKTMLAAGFTKLQIVNRLGVPRKRVNRIMKMDFIANEELFALMGEGLLPIDLDFIELVQSKSSEQARELIDEAMSNSIGAVLRDFGIRNKKVFSRSRDYAGDYARRMQLTIKKAITLLEENGYRVIKIGGNVDH